MSKEGGEDLQRLMEARNAAALKIENDLTMLGVRVGDTIKVSYTNGTSKTGVFNGWQGAGTGQKYIKLGTAAVPPVYIDSIELVKKP